MALAISVSFISFLLYLFIYGYEVRREGHHGLGCGKVGGVPMIHLLS